MSWITRLWTAIETALNPPAKLPVAPQPPTPTLRQLAATGSTTTTLAHLLPADPQPVNVVVVDSEPEWLLVAIIKSHRASVSQPLKGVEIVAPTNEEVDDIAMLFDTFAAEHAGAPVEFLLAAMCQESLFSVNCRNGNYLGKNPRKTNEGTDWGCGQVNGANLPDLFPKCKGDWPCLIAAITSPAAAIPLFCEDYLALLDWADGIIAKTDSGSKFPPYVAARTALYAAVDALKTTPKAQNRYWLAALAYNRGRTGSLLELVSGKVVPHPDHVAVYCNGFSDVMSIPHIMPMP